MLFSAAITLDWTDGAAVALFVAVWLGLGWRIENPSLKRPSVTQLMTEYRRKWMQVMLTRNPRIFDAQVMSSLRQGTAFFASTCLISVGGVLAVIGNVDPIQGVAEEIVMADSSATVWRVKLALVLAFLGHAFLKFVWSNRVFGHCTVLMAAVPNSPDDPRAPPLAAKAAALNIRAAINFNSGLRSLYFALAAIAWLGGPVPLFVATFVVAWFLWAREFRSIPRRILLGDLTDI